MGTISEIISSVSDLAKTASKTADGIANIASTVVQQKSGSISAKALQGTANFPVLVPDSLDLDESLMIAKSLEQRFATFLLTVLTMNPYMAVDKGQIPSAADYLKQFHQNMGSQYELGVKAISDEMTKAISTGKLFESETPDIDHIRKDMSSFVMEADNMGIDYNCWITEATQIVSAIYEGVSNSGINMDNAKFNYTIEDVTEQSLLNDKGAVRLSSMLEASGSQQEPKKNLQRGVNDPKAINYLGNNEFKKSNDSVSTLLHVRVYPYFKDSEEALDPLDFVVGVKATLHQIPSSSMVINIASGLRNDSKFFNFIRWTTGETKFFKDFLFAIDQQKNDARNSGSGVNSWWSALRRRRASSKLKKQLSNNGKGFMPNTTLICTMDDLLALKSEYGFDLTGPDTTLVRKLMDSYFLLAFVRVDPALQRVDFLCDGNTHYETATYSTLSKEGGKDDKKFKDMMKMLGRGA